VRVREISCAATTWLPSELEKELKKEGVVAHEALALYKSALVQLLFTGPTMSAIEATSPTNIAPPQP